MTSASNSLGPPGLNVTPPLSLSSKSTASATGNPRNKVALAPGRSLIDWIRLGKSGVDLTSVGGRQRNVTTEELAKHCTVDDAWTALRGNVYNITPYMEFHPGGISELLRAAGIDCTQLFDEVHKWVNYESMLRQCYIGKYVSSPIKTTKVQKAVYALSQVKRKQHSASVIGFEFDMKTQSTEFPPRRVIANSIPFRPYVEQKFLQIQPTTSSKTSESQLSKLDNVDAENPPSSNEPPVPRYDWYQTSSSVTVSVYTRSEYRVDASNVIVECIDQRQLLIRVILNDYTFHIHRELEQAVSCDCKVTALSSVGKIDIIFLKAQVNKQWSSLGVPLSNDGVWQPSASEVVRYWTCRVESIDTVTHDTFLYRLSYPSGCVMSVPVGRHVFVTASVSGTDVVHSYTVVPRSIVPSDSDINDSNCLHLMIKIYSDGTLTPLIGQLRIGDCLQISSVYAGNFDAERVSVATRCVLFAAGTGFTPMASILSHCCAARRRSGRCPEVDLVFFNKMQKDILWKDQLDSLESDSDWFHVSHVLSQPDFGWSGLRGRISDELFARFATLPPDGSTSTLVCACGPTQFTQEVVRLAQEAGFSESMIHAFVG